MRGLEHTGSSPSASSESRMRRPAKHPTPTSYISTMSGFAFTMDDNVTAALSAVRSDTNDSDVSTLSPASTPLSMP